MKVIDAFIEPSALSANELGTVGGYLGSNLRSYRNGFLPGPICCVN